MLKGIINWQFQYVLQVFQSASVAQSEDKKVSFQSMMTLPTNPQNTKNQLINNLQKVTVWRPKLFQLKSSAALQNMCSPPPKVFSRDSYTDKPDDTPNGTLIIYWILALIRFMYVKLYPIVEQ